MTQVTAISAGLAAAAVDAIRPARRVSTRHQAEDNRRESEDDDTPSQAGASEAETAVTPATGLLPDLSGVDRHGEPQAGLAEANAAYRALED